MLPTSTPEHHATTFADGHGLKVGAFAQVLTGFSKAFTPPTIPLNGTSTLGFGLTAFLPVTGLNFTDTLPAGVVVANPNGLTSTTCSNGDVLVVTAVPGSNTITLTGNLVTGVVEACSFSVNVTGTTPGVKVNSVTLTSSSAGSRTFTATLTVLPAPASTTTLTSSVNPSAVGQPVAFTATVTGSGCTPTGTVTFFDNGVAIGTGTVSSGVATFTTSTLALGSHPITATFNPAPGSCPASTSAVLVQVVGVPADSVRLHALQVTVTRIEAQASGSAYSGAVDGAIAEGFSDCTGAPIRFNGGLRFNLGCEPRPTQMIPTRDRPVVAFAPRQWDIWAEIRGTGWSTNQDLGDIHGGQTNALVGLTRKLMPNFLIGVVGGYENFDYSSQLLNGRMRGDGWTVGGYLGWYVLAGLRFDASVAHSGINYEGVAGTAAGSFPGSRWLATTGLTGTYKTWYGIEIEPSAKVYALWEHENAYTDSLGTLQTDRNFSTGRASTGVKLAYPWLRSVTTTVSPYIGVYADYYFNRDNDVALAPLGTAAPVLLPTELLQGWSARFTSGIVVAFASGPRLSIDGELGGLRSSFTIWTVRGRAALPF
jgi:Autotransporter beta-domain/Bacterial Ig-like domain (group 3)